MSSSSLLVERKLDVYLSFSEEIPNGNDFDYYLSQNGIKTFKSCCWKEKTCRPLDQRTLEALAESKVAVVMTSENKSYSIGFLEELVTILQFQEERSLIVIPIFSAYQQLDVEETSHPYLGPLEEAYPSRVPLWRKALTKLNNIAAQYSLSTDPTRASGLNRLKKIADDIWLTFLSSTSSSFEGLVAMERQIKAFHELLALGSIKEVLTIGIWGKSGVGKTTFARYIYEKISENFQTHIFLENVDNLEDNILSENIEGEEIRSLDHEEEHEITEARRKHQNVLLIADGVNKIEQVKWIAENSKSFGPGSRVIVISQNKNVLVESGVKYVYEVESLRYDEALELFSQFAFKQSYHPPEFERLALRAVHLAGFLPFALKLFGLFLFGKGKEEWEATLLKLSTNHGKDLEEVWKIMEA